MVLMTQHIKEWFDKYWDSYSNMQTHVYLCSNTLQKNLQRKQRDNFYLKKKKSNFRK